ncbi:patched domain-containing protein 3-like [Centruroides sculpturatus]|uniref:patched domain-containing protein 3-like n=1 Tax=Centruroides sculpturatus TaxID=218467 RepID=UPI000C6D6BBC|nr:patched domain-containing protein 3-like [Centruroides sculpturatus]
MNLLCIQYLLSRQFFYLGRLIGRNPKYFVIGPLLLTLILVTGLLNISVNRNLDFLFTARDGRAEQTKKLLEKFFPVNTSSFTDIVRITALHEIISVQIITKDGGSVFRKKVVNEVIKFHNIIKNITVKWNNQTYNYDNLCGKRNGKCVESSFLKLAPHANEILLGKFKVKYPLDMNEHTLLYDEYISSLGGVKTLADWTLIDAKGSRFIYFLDISNTTKTVPINLWRDAVAAKLRNLMFKTVTFSFYNLNDLDEEVARANKHLTTRIPIVAFTVMVFSFITCMTNDWIRSKPWLGISACISAGLAIASGIGLVCHLHIDFIDFNIGLCFIILGTEIDDAFVIISAWRCTSVEDTVEKRMGQAFSKAGVSITVTSLTNFVSFCIGMTTHFPAVQLFCGYAASCIFFTYVYQITFFGACMALSGYREEKELHCLTFRPIKGRKKVQGSPEKQEIEDFIMVQFRDKLGRLLTFPFVKFLVICIFVLNLGIGIWGFLIIRDGNDYSDLFNEKSSISIYQNVFFKYFNKYYFTLQIIIDKPLNYADLEVQNAVDKTIDRFIEHPHIAEPKLMYSWLKYYKMFMKLPVGKFLLKGYNMTCKEEFYEGLRNVFLRLPQTREFQEDIIFNEDNTEIIKTRFFVTLQDIDNSQTEIKVIKELYEIADKTPIPVKIHSFTFHLLEQALLIKRIVYQLGLISAGLICLLFFIFVPNITCAIFISSIVLCIICETIGMVSFLGVKIDMLLLTTLVLCVGFSINYPTHISFSFVMAKDLTPEERVRNSLYEIGFPMFQGTATTLLGPFMECL